ncbi:hypothetical protein MUK60_38185 [Streptomyces sp. LRE541]|uniref:hypothetical protein n=1 Tax=Streptomyces sp. LRE541 TaxID=2931983 RepID=UPI00200DA09B|nr:hypothetical protein [Streptomyces sp. LRE541]UPZ33112.1 hypothetical protein MUK60_38185 [Streptomyces sp. LRE541]
MFRRACIWRGPAFAGLNLVVEPAVDTLVDEVFGQLVDADGDRFLAALFATAPRPLAAADVTARVREAQDAFPRRYLHPTARTPPHRFCCAASASTRAPSANTSPPARTRPTAWPPVIG